MPVTRRSRKGQRLSDFFPAIDAPSPIVAKTPSTRRSTRAKTTSTPAATSVDVKSARRGRSTSRLVGTPVFDPELHGDISEDSHDSAEDEFVKSLTFSAVKPIRASESTPVARSALGHDYDIVVDYDSESDGFAFSPVKFTPQQSGNLKPVRKGNGTPAPVRRSKGTTRMVWNSERKRVEQRIIEDLIPESQTQSFTEIISDGSESDETGASSDSEIGPAVVVAQVGDSVSDQIRSEIASSGSPTSPSSPEEIPKSLNRKRRIPSYEGVMSTVTGKTSHNQSETPAVKASSFVLNQVGSGRESAGSKKSAAISPAKSSHVASAVAIRSPKVRLTRAVSGDLGSQRLETMDVPTYILSSETDTLRKNSHRYQPYARIPKKKQATVPQPFALSHQRPQEQIMKQVDQREPALDTVSFDRSIARDERIRGSTSQVLAAVPNRKRKASDAQEAPHPLDSPAKRVKLLDETRAVGKPRLPRNLIKSRSTVPDFRFSSEAFVQQKAAERKAKVDTQAKTEGLRPNDLGRVPRTLYSPEKNFKLNKAASVTKPEPFKFSTIARAARSPSIASPGPSKPISRPVKQAVPLRVPVLQAAPFIPKPSSHLSTVAASPSRSLPSRLETRREFDRVAGKHAEDVLRRKRKEAEALSAERERRMDERKGWRDSGTAAIEHWAARAKSNNSEGKRDWID